MAKRLWITGIGGFLGWNVAAIAPPDWELYGTTHRPGIQHPNAAIATLDLTDRAALTAYFDQIRPDAVLHLAALSRPNHCQTQPERSYAVNVTASDWIAELCAARQIPLLFTSSELVFDGQHPPYDETSPVCPINLYGEHKVLAERRIRDRYPAATIARMPVMFGVPSPQSESFLQPFLRQLRSGEPLRLFTDEIRMPVSATTAAQGLFLLLDQPGELFHLGGRDRLSRYDIGQLLTEIFEIPTAHLVPCRQADVTMAAPRAADLTLDSGKAFALGYNPPSVRSQLLALRDQV
ncbi:SDR family oxidoreductase [Spirulina major]|uniref:SDR family oxidoreductase n=1 Tax=Spirulina major TaxID=270636 RepID=UPI000933A51C|nr:NAD(P)-dependent oxidoreductase [Spirulina major]